MQYLFTTGLQTLIKTLEWQRTSKEIILGFMRGKCYINTEDFQFEHQIKKKVDTCRLMLKMLQQRKTNKAS